MKFSILEELTISYYLIIVVRTYYYFVVGAGACDVCMTSITVIIIFIITPLPT